MEKQTKNIITRETVKAKLIELNMRHVGDSITAVCFTVILIILAMWLSFSGLIKGFLVLKLIALILLTSILPFLTVPDLIRSLRQRKQIKTDDFLISEKAIIEKTQCFPNRHRKYDDFLSFEGFKDCPVPKTLFDLAERGDTCYIVYFNSCNIISLVYLTKTYKLDESMKK